MTLPLPTSGNEHPTESRLSAADWVCSCLIARKRGQRGPSLALFVQFGTFCAVSLAACPSLTLILAQHGSILLPLSRPAGSEGPGGFRPAVAEWVRFCSTGQIATGVGSDQDRSRAVA